MVVYWEYLFIENMLVGLFVSILLAKVMSQRPKAWRFTISSLLCGVYSFSMFAPINIYLSYILHIVFSILVSIILFNYHSFLFNFKCCLIFVAITLLYSGLSLAIIQLSKSKGVVSPKGVYLGFDSYISLVCICFVAAVTLYEIVLLLWQKQKEANYFADVCICFDGRETPAKGYFDSGNCLREPISGKPVVLASRYIVEKICKSGDIPITRFALIPYRTIGNEGVLKGFRVDYITYMGRTLNRPVLAQCDDDYFDIGEMKNDLILPIDILKGD